MTLRAFIEIVRTRIVAERRSILIASVIGATVGFVKPHYWLAGPMFVCALLGIALAFGQGPGRAPYLDACERDAPLFGRELARAKAAATLLASMLAVACYWAAQLADRNPVAPGYFAMTGWCVIATSLIALNATLRRGVSRWLYIAMSLAFAGGAYWLAAYEQIGAEFALCAIVGFIALRQYGEALARYEPIDL